MHSVEIRVECRTFLVFVTVPQGAPVNVTALPETTSSMRVSWKPVPKEKRNGTITQYNVTVANKSSGEVLRSVNVTAGNLSVEIDDLEMYATYSFQVQALTKEGAGPLSLPPVNGTTKQTGKVALEGRLYGYFKFESLARPVIISVLKEGQNHKRRKSWVRMYKKIRMTKHSEHIQLVARQNVEGLIELPFYLYYQILKFP